MQQDTDFTATEQPSPLRPVPAHDHEEADQAIDLSGPRRLLPQYFLPPQAGQAVLTSEDFINTPFENLPLYIPGLTQNIVNYDGGINKAALDVHRDKGLLCNLFAYLGMLAGDFIQLFCNDLITPVAIHNVTQDDVDKGRMIPMYIPRTRLPDGRAEAVHMRVTRVSGATNETARFDLKIDTIPPAGRNPIGSTLYNENLPIPIFPQSVIDIGVTDEDAQKGVPLTLEFYPKDATQDPRTFRQPRDKYRMIVNGVEADIPALSESQAAGRDKIIVTLYHGFWQKVGSGSHICEYEVIDEVGNASAGWSPAQVLNVKLNDGTEPLLPAPYLREAPTDILDHNALAGKDATIVVIIRGAGYEGGDIIDVKCIGRTVDGSLIDTTVTATLPPGTVNELTLSLENKFLYELIGGRMYMSVKRSRQGVPDRDSHTVIVKVVGTPIDPRLPAPRVDGVTGDVLDPQSPVFKIIFTTYPGQDPYDLVILVLEGENATGNSYYDEIPLAAGTGNVSYTISNGATGVIAGLKGGTLRLLCKVINEKGTRISQDVIYNVGDPAASLPEPEMQEAKPPLYQFDPEVSKGDANIVVYWHPDFRLNDTVVLYLEGSAPGGTPKPQRFPIRSHWVNLNLPFVVERNYILANKDKTLRVYHALERANTPTRFSHAARIKVGSRLKLQAPTVLEATTTGPDQQTLNPLHVLPPISPKSRVTIRVPINNIPPSADIKLFIIGKPGVGTPTVEPRPARPEPGENYVSFDVSSAFAAAYLQGEECILYYNLLETGKTTKSDELKLRVEALPAQHWDLVSVPQAQANSGVIDTSKPHEVRITAWPFMKEPQPLTVNLVSNGTSYPLRTGTPVSQAEVDAKQVIVPIPSSVLRGLVDGAQATIQASVSLDESGNFNTAQAFGVPTYRVKRQAGIIGSIDVGADPQDIFMSPDGSRVYVWNSVSGSISFIDTTTNRVIYTYIYKFASRENYIALSPDGATLYVSTKTTLFIVDTYTFTERSIPGIPYFGHIAVSGTGRYIYVETYNYANNTANTGISRLDRDENYKLELVIGYRNVRYGALVLNPESTRLYFGSIKPIYVHETVSHGLVTTLPAYAGLMSYNPYTKRIYSTTAATLYITDTQSPSLVKTVTMDATIYIAAFNPVRDIAYVPLAYLDYIQLVDTKTDALIGTIKGFSHPHGMAITPDGGLAYVCNKNIGTVSVVAL